mgnify:CR=1 FL=1
MNEKMLYFPNQNLPELNLTEADITAEYIQQVAKQWEEQPPDKDYKLILQAEAKTENGN